MAALCNRAGHYILPCGLFLSSSFFLSSPNLSGHRLDVYHTSTHGVALNPYHNYDKTYNKQLATLQLTTKSYHICNKTYNNSNNTCTTVVELISIKTCMHNIMQVVVSCSQSGQSINIHISKFVNKKHDGDEKVKRS